MECFEISHREEESMLRSEQDREYQEMLETDRRMQEEKQMVSYGVRS